MQIINKDLRELDLKESDLSDILWRAETPDGFRSIRETIRQQYLELLRRCTQNEFALIRAFVASTVTIGAVRGLQFGHALHRRQAERRSARDRDLKVECIIKHKKVFNLLLRTPKVSTRAICLALDDRGQELPWKELSDSNVKDSRMWVTHASNDNVKNTISRARDRAQQVAEDARYLRTIMRKDSEDTQE